MYILICDFGKLYSDMEKKSFHTRWQKFLYSHLWLKYTIDYSVAIFMCALSAFIFALGFKAFLSPGSYVTEVSGQETVVEIIRLVSGGASGLSQTISSLLNLIFKNDFDFYFILYVAINIPIIILAFKEIGIRFGAFTCLNVLLVSLFVKLFDNIELVTKLASFIHEEGGMTARALFAGLCTGVSSAICFKYDFSAGGIDVISYFFASKKSTNVGKYSVILNIVIVTLFQVINCLNGTPIDDAIGAFLFSGLYLFVTAFIIDAINIRNKKVQLQIITSKEDLSKLLIAYIPHGATLVKGQGAYSGKDKWIIYMDISQSETRKVVELAKKIDKDAFINVCELQQVYGRFFIKNVK